MMKRAKSESIRERIKSYYLLRSYLDIRSIYRPKSRGDNDNFEASERNQEKLNQHHLNFLLFLRAESTSERERLLIIPCF